MQFLVQNGCEKNFLFNVSDGGQNHAVLTLSKNEFQSLTKAETLTTVEEIHFLIVKFSSRHGNTERLLAEGVKIHSIHSLLKAHISFS